MSFKTNPFAWKEENITGTVGSVSLTRMDGTVIPVENLPEEIEVITFVPRITSYFELNDILKSAPKKSVSHTPCQILLPRPDFGMVNSTILDLANFSTLIIDIPSPDVTIVLKMEPSEDISFMLFLGYKDYPTDENYVAKTQIPQENFPEGKLKPPVQQNTFGYSVVKLKVFWISLQCSKMK